jgi:alkaline phosphatase
VIPEIKSKNAGISTAIILLAIAVFLSALPAAADTRLYSGQPAKYIFFFIGDGMGIPQRTAAEQYSGKRLAVDNFPAHGVTTTFAADRFITGSAASATSLASGQKTNIGMIGMAPDTRSVKTMAEMARELGMKVGIVSSVSIDHATPAAFYAHVPKRSMYYDIDIALADSGFDFFGGGGIKDPANKKGNAAEFKGDALAYIKAKGYKVVSSKADFMALKKEDGKVLAWNAHLPDGKAMPYVMDMTPDDITLPQFTAKAIELLNNPNGFFLMVEGGKIDWACHANDAAASIHNTLAFDEAVQVAIAFADQHPEDTLIVVTGDHECGGLTLGFAGTKYQSYFDILKHQNVSFQKFSDDVLAAYKKECTGKCSFDDIKKMINDHFGLKFEGDGNADPLVLKPYEIEVLREAYFKSMLGEKVRSVDHTTNLLYGGYEPLTVAVTHLLNNKAGLGWTSYKHTGVPVTTSAMGKGAKIFNGYYDNTDVALKIMSVMGIAPKIHYAGEPTGPTLAEK